MKLEELLEMDGRKVLMAQQVLDENSQTAISLCSIL